jgi:hypothetical protein
VLERIYPGLVGACMHGSTPRCPSPHEGVVVWRYRRGKKHGGYCHGCEPGGRRAYVIVILVSKLVAPVILTLDAAWLRCGCGLPKSVVPGAVCNPMLCMLKVSRECVLLWLHIPYISVCVYLVRRKEGPANSLPYFLFSTIESFLYTFEPKINKIYNKKEGPS